MTPTEAIQATSSGARSRGRGRFMPRMCLPALVNRLRLATSTDGEEDQQQDLGDLGGLNREAGQANPDLRAVLLGHRPGQHRRDDEKHQADQPAHVAVAGEHAVVGEEDDDEAERDHADERPQHLLVGARSARAAGAERTLGEVEAVNHDQPQAIQQRHHGEQQRIGVRREAADRQVGAAEQGEIADRVLRQVPAEALLLVGLDDQQRDGGDERGEPEQEQFGVAPVGQWRHDGHRRPAAACS